MGNSLATFIVVGSLLCIPPAIIEPSPRRQSLRIPAARYRRLLTWTCLAAAAWSCGVYLLAMRPFAESVDFYYYVCYARDMIHHPDDVPRDCYRYFPGVYAFWRTAIRLAGESSLRLQAVYLAVLLVNSALVGGIVFRGCRRLDAALFGGIWYLVLCSRFEGFAAVTEPIATMPFLAAMLAWGGRRLAGGRGYLLGLAAGAGVGGALYVKQQAGLLSLGAVSLLMNLVMAPREKRHDCGPLLAVPIGAAVVFLAGIACEARGWTPVVDGLRQASSYPMQSQFWRNLYAQIRNDESLALAAFLAYLAWMAILLVPRARREFGSPWLELVGFLLLSALATVVQFRWRAYYHYAMLAVPCVVAAAIILGVQLFRRLPAKFQESELLRLVFLVCAAFPLAYTGGNPANLSVWRIRIDSDFAPFDPWQRQPDVANDLAEVARRLKSGDELLVLPPRRNVIHWVLGTRVHHHAHGYYWAPPAGSLTHAVQSGQIPWVLEVTKRNAPGDEENWVACQADEVVSLLPSSGFRPVLRGETMTLWRRGA
ncbi:MAG: hypothetical protein ACOX1P_29880 [Thermoguttaceae bacterium]|jgi:hypothetical protein